jgi:hypothetical protein
LSQIEKFVLTVAAVQAPKWLSRGSNPELFSYWADALPANLSRPVVIFVIENVSKKHTKKFMLIYFFFSANVATYKNTNTEYKERSNGYGASVAANLHHNFEVGDHGYFVVICQI